MSVDSKDIYETLKNVVSAINATSKVLKGRRRTKIELKEYSQINETALLLLSPITLESLEKSPEMIARKKVGSLLRALEKEASSKMGKQLQKLKKIDLEFSGLKLILTNPQTGKTFEISRDSEFLQVPQKVTSGMRYYSAFIGLHSAINSENSVLQLCDLLTEFYSNMADEVGHPFHLNFPDDGETMQRELRRLVGHEELRALWILLRRLKLDKEIREANKLLAKSSSRKRPKKS